MGVRDRPVPHRCSCCEGWLGFQRLWLPHGSMGGYFWLLRSVRGCALGARNPSLFGASMEATYRACYRSGCLGLGLRVQRGDTAGVCYSGHVCWHLRSIGPVGLFPSTRCGFLAVFASGFD